MRPSARNGGVGPGNREHGGPTPLDRSPLLTALRMALEEIAEARAARRATLRVVVGEQRRQDGHAA